MAVLANISVALTDLQAIRPDILERFQYENESDDFAEEILRAKKTLYRTVLDYEREVNPSLTEAELGTLLASVKDLPDVEYLKERLVLMCIAEIFKANDVEQFQTYYDDAKDIALKYYIDENADSVVDDAEERQKTGVTLGR